MVTLYQLESSLDQLFYLQF